jgi:hypothetical protein
VPTSYAQRDEPKTPALRNVIACAPGSKTTSNAQSAIASVLLRGLWPCSAQRSSERAAKTRPTPAPVQSGTETARGCAAPSCVQSTPSRVPDLKDRGPPRGGPRNQSEEGEGLYGSTVATYLGAFFSMPMMTADLTGL